MSTEPATPRFGARRIFRILIVLAGAILGIAVIASAVAPLFFDEPEEAPVGAQVLPDLEAAPLIELTAGRNGDTEILFFSAEIANVGVGDFLVRAIRATPGTTSWRIRQRIPHATSGFSRVDIPTNMVFAGDTHDHWHVFRVARYRLFDAGRDVAADNKVGFCFFDNLHYDADVPGSPAQPRHSKDACDGAGVTALSMGMAPGWSDRYIWTLPGQSLDISGLEPGRYLLEMVVDPDGWFVEARTDNNRSWVEFELGRTPDDLPTVSVLSSGPTN